MEITQLQNIFIEKYGNVFRAFRSPGRINIIGEHTDYNEGFVLPAAIDKEIVFLIQPNQTETFSIFSADAQQHIAFTTENILSQPKGWPDYIIGIIDQLLKRGKTIPPFDCVFGGDIPIGAGMSSSAALCCAAAYALNTVYDLDLSRIDIIKIAQTAEREYAGLNCGIMDQFASVFSKKNNAVQLDCRDLSYKYMHLHIDNAEFILVNSMVKHALASSAYNTRRDECAAVVHYFQKIIPHISSLRDVSIELLMQHQSTLSEKLFNRAKCIVEENARVIAAGKALENGDSNLLGNLLHQSHQGLSKEYEVSCDELDFLVNSVKQIPGVYGARMMGGGFGGCSINLVETNKQDAFIDTISSMYKNKYGILPDIYPVKTNTGTSEIIAAI